jgi:rfaE bifunctional protein nucleotidyltransferase chain/domain
MGSVITLEAARATKGTRVFTNGIFDLLHVGHARYLQAARALGDCLIVGVNGDASARALKGAERPLVPQAERAELLAALACVDYVVVFEETTAERVVAAVRPEIYVKGGDYALGASAKVPPEAAVVQAYGGRVVFLPFTAGKSSTDLVQEILRRYRP